MHKILSSLLLLVILLTNWSCGVQFMTLSLEGELEEIDGFAEFDATSVYSNTTGDEVWGMEKDACKDFDFVTSELNDGRTAIKLDWNQVGCDWVGFGIGWNAWQPKDLSNIMETGALEFYIRSIEGETNIPLMILLLEDYGTAMSAGVFRPKHLENYPLNENWNRAVVPLSAFEKTADFSNIKQLVVELQGSGQVIIDEIKIIPYTPSEKSSAPHKPSITQLNTLPRILFDDTLVNVWGLEKNTCRNYGYSSETAYAGTRSLKLDWYQQDTCSWTWFGFSWNKWLGVDMNPVKANAAISFFIKTNEGTRSNLPLLVGLQDYSGTMSMIPLTEKYVESGSFSSVWREVVIPLDDLEQTADNRKDLLNNWWNSLNRDGGMELTGGKSLDEISGSGSAKINMGNIKQIFFKTVGTGSVLIDEVKFKEIPAG